MTRDTARPSPGFLLLYALAYAGGVIAYTPFLMLMLPARVTELVGNQDVRWLGYIVFAGAIAASLSGVASGWLSDTSRRRREWVALGLATTVALQLAIAQAGTIQTLLWLVVGWQMALNLMLTPLVAWAGDHVPDDQKGLLGGLLSLAPPLGALSAMLLPENGSEDLGAKAATIAAMTVTLVLPLLLFSPSAPPPLAPVRSAGTAVVHASVTVRVWLARLLMQLSGAALAAYLYFWLRSLDPALDDDGKMLLYAGGLTASVGAALLLGRWTDRHGRPFAALALTAVAAAAALLIMALADTPAIAKLAYMLFATANAAFLALHASQTLRILPHAASRGLGIGLFNLTNTAPSLIMPWIAISVVPDFGYASLFVVLALLALAAAQLLSSLPQDA
ncbi:MFS transporter [Blastomonas aquatica]|uniref:MFS transporter n=1 Tax=Blastomonas aquatica TaxID=1510276 RepID=UPI00166E4085|nr:MFS transporter [Blastomonas aquatica]